MSRRFGEKELRICRKITVSSDGKPRAALLSVERFPLTHQVSDFPHERLMLVDDRARRLVIFIEAGSAHDRLHIFDRLLAVRDACLEIDDALLPGIARFLVAARARFNPLAFFVGYGCPLRRCGVRSPWGLWRGHRRLVLARGRWRRDGGLRRGLRLLLSAPQELLIVAGIDERLTVTDFDHLRREFVDEVTVVRHENERAAEILERVEQHVL